MFLFPYTPVFVTPDDATVKSPDWLNDVTLYHNRGNSLFEGELIDALYRASQEGVRIDLIVRGICGLRPGIPGLSENIRVRSIIGRFLEHSRIYRFGSPGPDGTYYIGSADWMKRNLNRRVETIFPVLDEHVKVQLSEIMDIYEKDNTSAWDCQPDGTYIQRRPAKGAAPHCLPRVRFDSR